MGAVIQVIGFQANKETGEIVSSVELKTGAAVNFFEYQVADVVRWLIRGLVDDRTQQMFLYDPIVIVDEITAREQVCRQTLVGLGYVTEDGEWYHLRGS